MEEVGVLETIKGLKTRILRGMKVQLLHMVVLFHLDVILRGAGTQETHEVLMQRKIVLSSQEWRVVGVIRVRYPP